MANASLARRFIRLPLVPSPKSQVPSPKSRESQIPNPESRIPGLTPLAIAAAIGVPLRRRLEVAGFEQVLFDNLFVQRDAEAGFVGHRDETLVDDRFLDAVHQVAPPRHVHGM